jgi:hypothetical protein
VAIDLNELTGHRRLTLSQIVTMLLERGGGEHHSVTLARNAKGETQIEVVVRARADSEIKTPDEALAKAVELYNQACELYPPLEQAPQIAALERAAQGRRAQRGGRKK